EKLNIILMYTRIYTSKADPSLTHHEMIDMLENARVFNKKNDITGCLLYHEGTFIQLIEGKRIVVQQLYERILEDRRHHDITSLFSGSSSQRLFENWYMIYEEIDSFSNVAHKKQGMFRKIISETNMIPNLSGSPYFIFWKYANLILRDEYTPIRPTPVLQVF
ncbi:MAG: BLUF domain-containing protein, partial [Bacteroidota bacterium]